MIAVRELLQNALDTVKEQIARQRLLQQDPLDSAWHRKLGELHKVSLVVTQNEQGVWLICTDTGIGMTRGIIERHLLVGGSSALPEVRQLEREANACGFSTERSGQFGIGVLSYFMLADSMVITTRRSDLAGGDPEGAGCCFETDGLEGFGQLTKASRDDHGTEVRLRIRDETDQLSATVRWGSWRASSADSLDLSYPDEKQCVWKAN